MTMSKQVKRVPEGYHTITPSLTVHDAAAAIDFYKRAFGAEELARMPGPGGKVMHSELRIGDSRFFVIDDMGMGSTKSPKGAGTTTCSLNVYVEDCDAVWKRAVGAGATVAMPLDNQFWGDRYGALVDPYGHSWGIGSHVEDLTPEEMQKRGAAAMAQMGPPPKK